MLRNNLKKINKMKILQNLIIDLFIYFYKTLEKIDLIILCNQS